MILWTLCRIYSIVFTIYDIIAIVRLLFFCFLHAFWLFSLLVTEPRDCRSKQMWSYCIIYRCVTSINELFCSIIMKISLIKLWFSFRLANYKKKITVAYVIACRPLGGTLMTQFTDVYVFHPVSMGFYNTTVWILAAYGIIFFHSSGLN